MENNQGPSALLGQHKERQRLFASTDRLFLPDSVEYYDLGDATVVIAPLLARWCVFSHPEQVATFKLLQTGFPVGQVLDILRFTMSGQLAVVTMKRTLMEIEDKGFYSNAKVIERDTYACLKVNVTEGCNLRCRHCYRKSGVPLDHELETEDWVRIVEEHATLNGTSIMVSGGEPLFRKSRTVALLSRAKELGLETVLLTNGTLITAHTAELLQGLLDQVQISLDGPDAITNDSVRGAGVFERVIKAIDRFKQGTLRVIIAMTPLPSTLQAFEERLGPLATRLMSEFGERCVIQFSGGLFDGREITGLDGQLAQRWLSRIKALQNRIMGDGFNAKQDAASFEPGVRVAGCGYGDSLTVEADGRVLACRRAHDPVVADIRGHSLTEVRMRLRSLATRISVDRSPVCAACSWRYLCGGSCRFEPTVDTERKDTVSTRSAPDAGDVPSVPGCDGRLKRQLCRRLVDLNPFRYQSFE